MRYSGATRFAFRVEASGIYRYGPDGTRVVVAPRDAGTLLDVSLDDAAVLTYAFDRVAVCRHVVPSGGFSRARELSTGTCSGVDLASPSLKFVVVLCAGAGNIFERWNTESGERTPIARPPDSRGFSYRISHVDDDGDVYYTRQILLSGVGPTTALQEYRAVIGQVAPELVASYPGRYRTEIGFLTNDLILIDGTSFDVGTSEPLCQPTGHGRKTLAGSASVGAPIEVRTASIVMESSTYRC